MVEKLLPSDVLINACITGAIQSTGGQQAAIAFCETELTKYATDVGRAVSVIFGGPALVLGACWPFVLVSLIIATSRLFKLVSARSVFLMIATLGDLTFVCSIAYALHSSDANFKAADQSGLVGIVIMLIFTCMAGITRFSHVITRSKYRRMFARGSCTIMLIYGVALGYQAGREIADSPVHPTIFSTFFIGLFFIPVIVYLLGGLFCFSWNLPSSTGRSTPSGGQAEPFAMLKTLRLVNDVMMGIVIAVCISQLGVVFPLRTTAYNNSTVCLHVSIILFIENIFETVTNALRGRNAFSGYTSDRPTELSNIRPAPTFDEPFRQGSSSRKVGVEAPAQAYGGRETWAFGTSPSQNHNTYGDSGYSNPAGKSAYGNSTSSGQSPYARSQGNSTVYGGSHGGRSHGGSHGGGYN
ncbi:hypothetical protein DFJ77DRAFT_467401 [Powellomyces hirtus]|nr:hypothetical protein DFJ77DRAFT_467401 [Powellomyces hirtus]